MHLNSYILTLAEDESEAIGNARGCVEDYVGEKQWFDYGDVDVDGDRKVVKIFEIRATLVKYMEYSERELENALKYFDENRAMGERGAMGYQASRIHAVCSQSFTSLMPFWNMESGDWQLPEDDDFHDEHGRMWYAVPIDLHF